MEKWSSGKAVCYGDVNYNGVVTDKNWGSVVITTSMYYELFPTNLFTTRPHYINVEVKDSSSSVMILPEGGSSKLQTYRWQFLRATTDTLNCIVSIYAIGRWK